MTAEDGFLEALEASTVDVNEAITLPPACYTSEEFLAFERRAIFDRDWVCIGHEGQIPDVGDYFCVQLFDVRLAQAKADVDNFNGADIHADTMVQVGLRSRFAPRGPYSWQEATLQQINRWLVKRYREHYRRDPSPAGGTGL